MSKVNIKTTLKSKNENKKYEGKAIKEKNKITYIEDKIKTIILNIEDMVTIERIRDYHLKINLKKHHKLKGTYKSKYGNLNIETYTKDIKIEKNKVKIKYDLYINAHLIDTFTYNLEYSIDS